MVLIQTMSELLEVHAAQQEPAPLTEKSPTLDIAQSVLDRIKQTRRIGNLELAQLGKTGSRLDIVTGQEHRGVVRNAELPESSMAAWEFLQSYAHTLFPQEIKDKLFGVWGRAQVAPILQRPDGSNRVYYQKNQIGITQGSAYSEMVGFTTPQLVELWGIKGLHETYSLQEIAPGLQGQRSRDSLIYWLAKDLTDEIPEVGNHGELMGLLNEWWEEYVQLNKSKASEYKHDEFDQKEVSISTVFTDDPFISSLRLIDLSHRVAAILREQITKVESDPTINRRWLSGPVKETLLYLLHNQQATAQQMLMWWLGVAHGHLHSSNIVSRVPEEGVAVSPLQTHIIDFDAARLSPYKLQDNSELYETIDGERILSLIKNASTSEPIRTHLLAYLPLANWDTEVYTFFTKCHAQVRERLLGLIVRRAATEKIPPTLQRVFLFAAYRNERNDLRSGRHGASPFPMTLALLRTHSEDIELPLARNITPYIQLGDDSVLFNSLSSDEQSLLVAALDEKLLENSAYKVSTSEWQWLVNSLNAPEPLIRISRGIIRKMLLIKGQTSFTDLYRLALAGTPEATNVLREIWLHFFLSEDKTDSNPRKWLIQQILTASTDEEPLPLVTALIGALDFSSLSPGQRNLLRDRILENIEQFRQFNPSQHEIKKLMEDAVSI